MLGLVLAPAYFILIYFTFLATKLLTVVDTTFTETTASSPVLYQFYMALPTLILIKPISLMPALIIVLDCRLLDSWHSLKYCRLTDAKELILLFCFSVSLSFIWILLKIPTQPETTAQYILNIIPPVLTQLVSLTVAVLAIRFVASRNLVYHKNNDSLDSQQPEETLDYPTED